MEIPNNKETNKGKKSVLTSKMPTLKQVFERYLNNPKVKIVMVDIKPASDEDIYQGIFKAAMEIPNNKETNKKLYFLSRTNKSLELLKKRFPGAKFALEGPKGDEPMHDYEKWIPEVTGNKRQSHNAISLSIGMLFVKKVKPFKINEFVKLAHKHHYSVAGWTISRERKLIRVANKIPNLDLLLTDKDRSEIATIQLKRHFKLKD
jgi:glycerophosphoryl diester phosphodiesterase